MNFNSILNTMLQIELTGVVWYASALYFGCISAKNLKKFPNLWHAKKEAAIFLLWRLLKIVKIY